MPRPFRSTLPAGTTALLVALSACREKPAESAAESRDARVFPLRASPVRVTVSRDSARSVSARVPAAGGAISAIGSDGSRFTLTVPPRALDSDTMITLTPISALGGLPLKGGMVAGVHLEPEGLRFNLPAVLRIEPAREVPVQQQVGFGYLGGGDDFHAYPLDQGRALSMRLLHFSGAGVAAGSSADVRALRQRSPADAAAQLEQRIADLLGEEREARLTGADTHRNFSRELTELLEDFYQNVVLPKLDVARGSDDWRVMFDAVQTAVTFVRVSTMLGEDQSALSRLLPMMEPILVRGFDRAYTRCTARIGTDKEARLLMIVARNAALTIFGVDPNDPRFSQKKIMDCFGGGAMLPAHLELSLEATIVAEMDGDGNQVLMSASSTMRLEQTPGSTTYYVQGWAPIKYGDLRTIAGPGCPSYRNLKPHDGVGSMGLMVHPDGRIGAMNLTIQFEKGPWEEWTLVDCDGKGHPSRDVKWARALNQLENVLTRENKPGYVGVPTGMSFAQPDPILSSTIERTDYSQFYKKGVIKYALKVLP